MQVEQPTASLETQQSWSGVEGGEMPAFLTQSAHRSCLGSGMTAHKWYTYSLVSNRVVRWFDSSYDM